MNTISGQLIDLHQRRIYPAAVTFQGGRIIEISELAEAPSTYILPGFIDAHVHIESSMLSPSAFAQMALPHGTVATVSDPHEIANVCGAAGVKWMIRDAKTAPLKIFFGAPSCVPATSFETAGAVLDAAAVDALLASPDIHYLSEMMNYPGVLYGDSEVMAKIAAAGKWNKPVDGHAPGLRGAEALRYAAAGISTDHECTSLDEALDKIAAGMHILIREGSAAKNFEALHPLLELHPERVMFCSDDKHPDDLAVGHINQLVTRALALGYDLFDVLRAACVNPVRHYGLDVGLLRKGDAADFIIVPEPGNWQPVQVYVGGVLCAESGKALFEISTPASINEFHARPIKPEDLALPLDADAMLRVITAQDGQLVTGSEILPASAPDVLKLIVLNRYQPSATPAIAFIRGFGLRAGAIASTVAHDCHNIIAVGVDDASICAAINAVVHAKGGISVAPTPDETTCMPLPFAGLMSDKAGPEVAEAYAGLSEAARSLGSSLHAPFMTLSFMALLVIPALKLSDLGLFNGATFLFEDAVC